MDTVVGHNVLLILMHMYIPLILQGLFTCVTCFLPNQMNEIESLFMKCLTSRASVLLKIMIMVKPPV